MFDEIPLLSPSQDREPNVLGPYQITDKWLRPHVGNSNKKNQHTNIEQFYLSSRLWILLFVLLLGMSPNTCSGACVMHVQSRPNPDSCFM